MAMFGYVYLWYLMAVLVFEIWLDYRRDIVLMSQQSKGVMRLIYKVMTLGSSNISERALHIDDKVGWIVTLVGIPRRSCCTATWVHLRLHQGQSMVVVAADAGGIHFFRHGVGHRRRDAALHGDDQAARTKDRHALRGHDCHVYVLYLHHRFSLEMLDLVHRIYEADESFRSLNFMVHTRLYIRTL